MEVSDGSVELDPLTAAAMASAFAGRIIWKFGPKSTFSFSFVFIELVQSIRGGIIEDHDILGDLCCFD